MRSDTETLTCPQCGNIPDTGGFDPCLPDGTVVEPTLDSGWDCHYRCRDCDLVVIDTHV